MADDVRAALGTMDRETRIEVESPGDVDVSCDGTLVRRVMENLVSNAIKHTPAGTPIRISIARGDGRVRVAVHDKGGGVPPEARAKIFEKFGTVESRQSGPTTPSGWVSRSASSPSRPMAGPSA